jgi:autotransporter-associated beta strand protein
VQVGNGTIGGSLGTGPVTDNGALIFNEPGDTTLNNNIGGMGSLTHQGTTALVLSGNNSFSGGTTISSGTLQAGVGGPSGSVGTGPVTNNGTLVLNRNGTLTIGSPISGTGTLIVNGPGTITLSGANSYQANTYISNGVVKLGASEVIPDGGSTTGWLILDGGPTAAGTLDLNGFNETINSLAGLGGTVLGKIVNNGGSGTNTLTINGTANTTFAGQIQDNSGAGGKLALVKAGTSTLTLTPGGLGNTYTGGTIISNGIVSGGSSTTANGHMVGAGAVTLYDAGGLQLGGFTGSTTPDYGTFSNPVILASNATATVFGTSRGGGFAPSSVTGPTNSTLTFVTRYVRGNFGGDWTSFKGLLIVSNTTASANTDFRLNTTSGFPNARVYLATGGIGGAYVYNLVSGTPIIPIGELTGDSTATIALSAGSSGGQPARWSVGSLNTTAQYNGGITDTHGIIKVGTGTWTLTSANLTYTGPTIVSNGALAFSASAALPPSSIYIVAAPGKLDVSAPGALTVANTVEGDGTILGSLIVNGTVMPGFSNAPGVLTVTNSVSLGGTTLITLNRTNSLNSGQLVAPSITYGGTLTLTNIGPAFQGGETFQLFSGALSGTFATNNLPALAPGLNWDISKLNGNGSLSIVGHIIPPQIGPVQVSGTTNLLSGIGGMPNGAYKLLSTTNVGLPLSSWTVLTTGTFAADGSWSYTNTAATNVLEFYTLVEELQ